MALGLALAGALALSGCAAGSSGEEADGVTIEWWHIQTQEPTRGVWQELADEFEASHEGVNIDITVQNDPEFKTGIDARAQAGDLPDIYQTWGGGVLGAQVDAGLVQDLSESTSGWIDTLADGAVAGLQIDGKQYGVPYDSGLVGVWYNKALFAQAGIDAPPTTWEEFVSDVKDLRAAGITPLAVGAGDKWPAMFYWAEGGLAEGGSQPFIDAGETGDFTDDAFIAAGERINELVAANAFQDGFLGSAYAEAGGASSLVANGQAAMELMGSWAPGTQASVAENGKGLGVRPRLVPIPAWHIVRPEGRFRWNQWIRGWEGCSAGGCRVPPVPAYARIAEQDRRSRSTPPRRRRLGGLDRESLPASDPRCACGT